MLARCSPKRSRSSWPLLSDPQGSVGRYVGVTECLGPPSSRPPGSPSCAVHESGLSLLVLVRAGTSFCLVYSPQFRSPSAYAARPRVPMISLARVETDAWHGWKYVMLVVACQAARGAEGRLTICRG